MTPERWLFGHKFARWRVLSWWTFAVLAAMAVLFPVELLLEAGIDESKRCRPRTAAKSSGVCASPMRDGGYPLQKRGSDSKIYAQMVLIQNFVWADSRWDFVPVGASKKPRPSEVRLERATRSSDRQYLAKNCTVSSRLCRGSECGSATVA